MYWKASGSSPWILCFSSLNNPNSVRLSHRKGAPALWSSSCTCPGLAPMGPHSYVGGPSAGCRTKLGSHEVREEWQNHLLLVILCRISPILFLGNTKHIFLKQYSTNYNIFHIKSHSWLWCSLSVWFTVCPPVFQILSHNPRCIIYSVCQ